MVLYVLHVRYVCCYTLGTNGTLRCTCTLCVLLYTRHKIFNGTLRCTCTLCVLLYTRHKWYFTLHMHVMCVVTFRADKRGPRFSLCPVQPSTRTCEKVRKTALTT